MKALRNILKVFSLTCDESTRLVSDGYERDLAGSEKAALRLHLLICGSCRKMRRQFDQLQGMAQQRRADAEEAEPVSPSMKLSDEAATRVKRTARD